MVTKENCSEYVNCGFAKFLNKMRQTTNSDCEKKSKTCGRLNPKLPLFKLEEKLPFSDEELKTAFPIINKDDGEKPQRIFRGTHR